jgi:putative tryptophan/tyrosine transport system substrate-binding protein
MWRREFIRLFSSTVVAWPLTSRAQQAAMPVIGFLNSSSAKGFPFLAAFRQGLSESGYVEGQNLAIEYRWADGDYEKLPRLAADLVGHHASVIFAGGPPAVVAAKAATTTIPYSQAAAIRSSLVSCPVSRPGGNVTGVSFLLNELGAKRLELLHELVSAATSVGFLANPTRPSVQSEVKNTQQAAQALGVKLIVLNASTEAEIDTALAEFSRQRITALLVGTDSFFLSRRDQIVALANRLRIATMYDLREYVDAGGLFSYAPSVAEVYRQAGIYVAKIVKGAKPAELPVLQPTKFDLVINLKTAKALGLTVPTRCNCSPATSSNRPARCRLMVQSGHPAALNQCPLLGVKRTLGEGGSMSAFDPKQTSASS